MCCSIVAFHLHWRASGGTLIQKFCQALHAKTLGNMPRLLFPLVSSDWDTHSGSSNDLEGRDYTFYIEPTDGTRIITVETHPSNGSQYDVSGHTPS